MLAGDRCWAVSQSLWVVSSLGNDSPFTCADRFGNARKIVKRCMTRLVSKSQRHSPSVSVKLILVQLAFFGVMAITQLPNVAVAQSDMSQVLQRIDRLERDLRDLRGQVYRGGSSGTGTAPVTTGNPEYMMQRADQLEDEIRKLTGKMEEMQFVLDQNAARVERLANDLDFRLKAVEGGKSPAQSPPNALAVPTGDPSRQGVGAASAAGDPFRSPPAGVMGTIPGGAPSALPPAAPSAAPATAPATALPGGSPEEQYKYAFGLMRQSDFAGAETAFREFIARNPKSDLAGNADYWLGESFYVRGNYQAAAAAYLDTVQNYGNGAKGPDALLKLGMSLALLNQKADACQTLKALPGKYPKAEAGLKERAKLEAQRAKCG